MVHLRPRLLVLTLPAFLGLAGAAAPLAAAEPPAMRELRIQQVGDVTYFHVQFATPKRMTPGGEVRLVPQDNEASHVCQRRADERGLAGPRGAPPVREARPESAPREQPPAAPRQPVPVDGIEFTGRLHGKGEVQFVLLYPTENRTPRLGRFRPAILRGQPRINWAETSVVLDFDKAKKIALPAAAKERRAAREDKAAKNQPAQWPVRDDLEGLWVLAQIDEFARLQNEVTEFGFYSFAIQAAARKHHVPTRPELNWNRGGMPNRGRQGGLINQELYETTTGATAIAESLQLQRMLNANFRDTGKRSIPIAKIEGIDVAEHPWDKMMGDKKPAPEPMAKLIPNDNYYIHFKNVRQFITFSDLLDQWGTNLIRAYEVHSRDYRLKERYQQQLCLRTTELGRKFGPVVLRGLAITGSDAYLREGSDVAIIFHVANRPLFLGAVQPFIEEARKKFGDQLKERKIEENGVIIESFTTPLREVSLHRATVEEYVIYANSPVGLRRILATYRGGHKALADARDFQYMRTIFRHDDKDEAGFAYLSDAFIRQLVGPASKIKEKRRLEALTSMVMLNEGALYHAWETGKPPADHNSLLASAGLKPEEVYLPEGRDLLWNPQQQVAVSEVYNTVHFATPLVELPIEQITEAEAQAYRQFRLQYLGLWRQYFDPIGLRIALDDKRVKLDTYILPLVANSQYNELRRVTGEGTVSLDLGSISPKTIAQFMMHLSPNVGERRGLLGLRGTGGAAGDVMTLIVSALDPVGKWVLMRADDSPVYGQLADLLERSNEGGNVDIERVARLIFQMPVMVGMDVKNPLSFAATLAVARTSVMKAAPGALTWEPLEKPYKGVSIVQVKATPAGMQQVPIVSSRGGKDPFLPAVYYAMIEGAFYLTPNEAMLRDFIDRAKDKREGKAETVQVNSSLYVSPGAARLTRGLLQKYLEKQIHEQALASAPIWYPLYHSGLIMEGADRVTVDALAERYYGFVPVSPDGAAYGYDRRTDEVRNERHGSPARPKTHKTLAENAQIKQLLEQLISIRADLRFREDGIHTTLTVDRQAKEK
ncbi:MAG TPA: hypothetical protein VN688_28060 [Gemmataceae bacterium]|nr:hypothetical protein [Gemmataceae bacterium]